MKEEWPALVAAARRGDNEACAALYRETAGQMMGLARSMVKNEEDALDLLQESYLYAFRSLERLEKPEYFRTWLYRIVINRCKNFLTRSKPRLFESSFTDEEGEERDWEDEDIVFRPDDSLDYSETKRLIREIVDGLPEDQRAYVLLYYFQEKKVSEIARDLEVPENTVKSRLSYGKKKIRQGVQALEQQGTKLYAVPVFPFIKWMLEESIGEFSRKESAALLSRILGAASGGAAAGAAGSSAVSAAGAGAASAVKGGIFASFGAKVTAGVLAVLLTVGGGAAIMYLNRGEDEPAAPAEELVSESLRLPAGEEEPETDPLPSSEEEWGPDPEPERPRDQTEEPAGAPDKQEQNAGSTEEQKPEPDEEDPQAPEEVVRLINEAREKSGLAALEQSDSLMEIARYQAAVYAGRAETPVQTAARQLESYGVGYAEKKTMGYANYRTPEELMQVLSLTGDFVTGEAFDRIGVGSCRREENGQLHWYVIAVKAS